MKNILVPIGSSENASLTLQYAIDLAEQFKANIYVFRVYKVPSKAGTITKMSDFIGRETILYIRSIIKSVDVKNVQVKMISVRGSSLDSIKTIHKKTGIDLIVLSTKSNSENDNSFLGSTSGSIIKKTKIPALIVPDGYTYKPISTILTAFKSGIINKVDVLNPLQTFSTSFKAKIDLLLVKTPGFNDESLVLDPQLIKLKSSATASENKTTYQGVQELFKSKDYDMLCVFRRKRGFFKKLWEKNTIRKKDFNCNIPMLVLNGML